MVVKRTCSFCAGEIEPGTGMMFVKRDGTIFHFCTSSCRKQQLHLGRVGHRLKWTRAHTIKRQTEQSSAAGKTGKHKPAAGPLAPAPPAPAATPPAKDAPPAAAPTPKPPDASETPTPAPAPAKSETGDAPAAPAKKPRAKKPKEPSAPA
jgi:large subunit ribosomal protein L24e